MLTLQLIEACDKLASAKTLAQADQAASQILHTFAGLAEASEQIEKIIREGENEYRCEAQAR